MKHIDNKEKHMKDKIKKHNLDKIIIRLKDSGMRGPEIQEEIARETGIKLHLNTIYNFLKKDEQVKHELVQKDQELQKTARELAINYRQEINDILTEVKEIKKEAIAERDYQIVDKMIGRLFQGLDLINRIVDGGNIKNQKVDVKVLYQNIFDESHEKYQKLKDNILSFNSDVDSFVEEQDKEAEEKLKKQKEKEEKEFVDADYVDVREL